MRFVSGPDFSQAVPAQNRLGFSPCGVSLPGRGCQPQATSHSRPATRYRLLPAFEAPCQLTRFLLLARTGRLRATGCFKASAAHTPQALRRTASTKR
jgi:hypothetical protein